MTVEGLIIWLVIGAIAGWLAGLIMEGYGFGLIGNVVVGIVGALFAGWLLPRIGFVLIGGIGAEIINAVIGAVILLAVIGLFKRATWIFRAAPSKGGKNENVTSSLVLVRTHFCPVRMVGMVLWAGD